ncbi:hypothetical protein LJR225_002650 [Phenylobacterium sp. LjRoot225]|uniref:hypothetical protein n=1 Tax=Phenylobacterium sp. LjRoot225 TaxID=3342285 RepID=UPI003ECFFE07
MSEPLDTSDYPTGAAEVDYGAKALTALEALKADARAHVESWASSPPVKELVLAFGVAPLVGVFLVRFAEPIASGELEGGTEMWAVAGDLPAMCFETEDARVPSDALRLYCAIAEDWAETVLADGDLSQCYPIPVEPSAELAEMLQERIALLRKDIIPLA